MILSAVHYFKVVCLDINPFFSMATVNLRPVKYWLRKCISDGFREYCFCVTSVQSAPSGLQLKLRRLRTERCQMTRPPPPPPPQNCWFLVTAPRIQVRIILSLTSNKSAQRWRLHQAFVLKLSFC